LGSQIIPNLLKLKVHLAINLNLDSILISFQFRKEQWVWISTRTNESADILCPVEVTICTSSQLISLLSIAMLYLDSFVQKESNIIYSKRSKIQLMRGSGRAMLCFGVGGWRDCLLFGLYRGGGNRGHAQWGNYFKFLIQKFYGYPAPTFASHRTRQHCHFIINVFAAEENKWGGIFF
jgi:hypothetical protein